MANLQGFRQPVNTGCVQVQTILKSCNNSPVQCKCFLGVLLYWAHDAQNWHRAGSAGYWQSCMEKPLPYCTVLDLITVGIRQENQPSKIHENTNLPKCEQKNENEISKAPKNLP